MSPGCPQRQRDGVERSGESRGECLYLDELVPAVVSDGVVDLRTYVQGLVQRSAGGRLTGRTAKDGRRDQHCEDELEAAVCAGHFCLSSLPRGRP